MWFRAFKKSKPDCFAPQALIGPAFSFRAAASVTREAEGGYRTATFSRMAPSARLGFLASLWRLLRPKHTNAKVEAAATRNVDVAVKASQCKRSKYKILRSRAPS